MTSNSEPRRVRVLFADQLNLARGKYLPASIAKQGETRACIGLYGLTYSKAMVVDAPGAMMLEGLPDIELRFDPVKLRPGWEPRTDVALADLEYQGAPLGLSGRAALKKAIADWEALGFYPEIGLEAEAYLFQRDEAAGTWVPYDTPGAFVYGTGPFNDPEGLVDDIWLAAEKARLPLESFNSEFDSPQFELTLRHADALTACDDFFLFRTLAREILCKKGFLLSFLPAPLAGQGGSGLHINISFRDSRHGKNLLAGATGRGALSPLVSGCIAGLLAHHEGLGGILAPTENSYARLKPANLCGYWANWGHDHRGAAVRLAAETGPGARIEHRVGDCAASPYVAVAAVLQAARLGYVAGMPLPEEETGDGLEEVNTDRHIAEDLIGSLRALEADTALVDATGRPLIENYLAIKRAEAEELKGKSFQQIFDYYAWFI